MNSPSPVAEFPLSAGSSTGAALAAGAADCESNAVRPRRFRVPHVWLESVCDLAALAAAWGVAARVTHFNAAGHAAGIPPLESTLLLFPTALLLLHARRRRMGRAAAALLSGLADRVIVLTILSIAAGLFARQSGGEVSLRFLFSFPPLLLLFTTVARAALRHGGRPREVMGTAAVLGGYSDSATVLASMRKRGDRSIRGIIVPDRHEMTAETSHDARLPGGPAAVKADLLGSAEQLGELVNRFGLTRIIVLEHGLERDLLDHVLAVTARMRVNTSRILDVQPDRAQAQLIDYYGVPLLDLAPPSGYAAQGELKRILDLLGSSLLLLLLAPILVGIALLIKLSGHGPLLYRGARVGRGGRHFVLYKFRSMRHDPEHRRPRSRSNARDGHLFKMRRDPRVTRLGAWLRRYSLDELPQLVNVLRGDMSLVGPRPLPAEDLEPDGLSRRFREWSLERAEVAPGITGLWQVRGRSDLPFDRMVELDLHYAREWSPILDMKILLETPLAVLAGRGAY